MGVKCLNVFVDRVTHMSLPGGGDGCDSCGSVALVRASLRHDDYLVSCFRRQMR